jgi:hypothetical protein
MQEIKSRKRQASAGASEVRKPKDFRSSTGSVGNTGNSGPASAGVLPQMFNSAENDQNSNAGIGKRGDTVSGVRLSTTEEVTLPRPTSAATKRRKDRIKSEPDFINAPEHGDSLDRLMSADENREFSDKDIRKLLLLSRSELEMISRTSMEKLRRRLLE